MCQIAAWSHRSKQVQQQIQQMKASYGIGKREEVSPHPPPLWLLCARGASLWCWARVHTRL